MGFWSRLFGKGKEPISDEVKQARARLGITIDKEEEKEERKRELAGERKTGWEFDSDEYDPWDELKNVRMNFWIGGWAAKRLQEHSGIDYVLCNTDKLREELEEVQRKREEKEAKQWEKAASDESLRRKLEEAARKREEKERKAREKDEARQAKIREKERRD